MADNDVSLDPFNDYDIYSSNDDYNNSSLDSSSDKEKYYPPQQVSDSFYNSSSTTTNKNSNYKHDNKDSLDLNDLLDEPISHSTSITITNDKYPQTADMLSMSFGLYDHTDSFVVPKKSIHASVLPKPKIISPKKEQLLKNTAKQKINEFKNENKSKSKQIVSQNSLQVSNKKRKQSPVSPIYTPPKKFRRTNAILVKKELFPSSNECKSSFKKNLCDKSIVKETNLSSNNTNIQQINKPDNIIISNTSNETNINHKSLNEIKKKPVILTSSLSQGMREQIYMLTKKIGGETKQQYCNEVTHLVIFCDDGDTNPKTTIKFHQCILAGCWIVSFSWILASFKEKKWLSEIKYIAKGHPGIILGRKNRLLHNPRLFYGYSFYIYGDYKSPSKKELESLVTLGHGKLLSKIPELAKTPKEALENEKYVIILCHTDMSNEQATNIYFKCGLQPLAFHYLLDIISQYQILNNQHYKFLDDDNTTYEPPMSLTY